MHQEVSSAGHDRMTPNELKKFNQKNLYHYVYSVRQTSKQAIAQALDLSRPTVSQHLTAYIEAGLIETRGEYESSGGRKAKIVRCNSTARIAIGVEVLKESVHITALDLYGISFREADLPLGFSDTDAYYRELGGWIDQFAAGLPYPRERLLGVCIAIQGLVSQDGETITFSEILRCSGVRRETFQKYISLPCSLIHDTEAAARAELWSNPDIDNAIYLALNRNFGGAVILNNRVPKGRELSGGTIEHMCLSPGGPSCYCGKQGCIETFCSADSLKAAAQMELPQFFQRVHSGDPRCSRQWRSYLRYLAIAVDNIRMIVDFDFILGGFLIQYMTEADFNLLTRYVREQCAFESPHFSFRISKNGDRAAKTGAALTLVERFLEQV